MNGTLYGVSVGPGDPELLTLKAARIIAHCTILATPITNKENTLALDIVKGACDVSNKEILKLPFLMTRDKDLLEKSHTEITYIIEEKLKEGFDIAFLNLGDISVYSSFAYIMEKLLQKDHKVVMIPGVTSFCAVACTLNISLTSMNTPLHIIPASSGISVENALDFEGTKVLMKSGKSLPMVKEAIKNKNLSRKTKLVQNCGLPNEIICTDISKASDDASYFTTIIVKE